MDNHIKFIVEQTLPAVDFENFFTVLNKYCCNISRIVIGGLHLVKENLFMEEQELVHVAEDELGLVLHVSAGHDLLVAHDDGLQVLDVLPLCPCQLCYHLLVSETRLVMTASHLRLHNI